MLIYVWMAIANNQQFWTWHLKCTYSYSLFSQRICSCTGCTATRMYACVCVRVHCATHSAHSIQPAAAAATFVWCVMPKHVWKIQTNIQSAPWFTCARWVHLHMAAALAPRDHRSVGSGTQCVITNKCDCAHTQTHVTPQKNRNRTHIYEEREWLQC